MKKALGVITIGQSPRNDVVSEMQAILGDKIEILQAGALDGLTREEILTFKPVEGDYVLVSRLRDGGYVKFGESYIVPRLQECIDKLQEKCEAILFICTGKFPDIFQSKVPLLFPQQIIHSVVPKLSSRGKIGVINPDKDQIKQCVDKWSESIAYVEAVAGSPYTIEDEITKAAEELKDKDVDLIVMDCIGYTLKMKDIVKKVTQKPVILSRTIVARVISELLN